MPKGYHICSTTPEAMQTDKERNNWRFLRKSVAKWQNRHTRTHLRAPRVWIFVDVPISFKAECLPSIVVVFLFSLFAVVNVIEEYMLAYTIYDDIDWHIFGFIWTHKHSKYTIVRLLVLFSVSSRLQRFYTSPFVVCNNQYLRWTPLKCAEHIPRSIYGSRFLCLSILVILYSIYLKAQRIQIKSVEEGAIRSDATNCVSIKHNKKLCDSSSS